jgi:hypothetical protein
MGHEFAGIGHPLVLVAPVAALDYIAEAIANSTGAGRSSASSW